MSWTTRCCPTTSRTSVSQLVNNSTASGSRFFFFLIDDPQINAFAGPGGYIGIYTGLLLTTETESELAAVTGA